ncbi:AMP-binding protein [Dietzia sp. SYD-A1]|uniref:AMP-binding protein n=1 Tax=Dietzia sp. SYD-A1 TaxID=2780141 RepID=UPI00189137C9|nr:AMP-binding protein [Dietzia sp. SYD-A1]
MTIEQVGHTRRVGGLAGPLAARGRAVAVISDDTTLTYTDLALRVAARAAEYPSLDSGRQMVGLIGGNTTDFLIDYLAAHEAGHVVLLLPPESAATRALVESWTPDVLAGAGQSIPASAHHTPPRHDLHPDLALLLSTSGSTGSPKLVRQSRRAVLSNAAAITEYLRIVPADRAITTLPPHYCYGLSVIHSHLLAGASVVLNEDSVASPEFWERAGAHGVTTFAAVPHTVELLERVGLDRLDHLTRLRYLTQAGGRLAPEKVRTLAERLEARDAELVVMYGQTEATARMGYLPPHLARGRAGAIGVAIPGGAFRVDRPKGSDPDAPGELVYSGPNVMMGYARESADLARGPELTELRTGDLARIAADGLVEIVGRMGREAKIFGHRIDLGRVEAALADRGLDAWCVGEPDRLVVVTKQDTPAQHAVSGAAASSGLPASAVEVLLVDEPPRTPAGKIDQPALRELVAERGRTCPADAHGTPGELIAHAFGLDAGEIDPAATFVDLGGDSLTYVVLSTRLEDLVPGLPRDWHLRPVGELDELARVSVPAAARWWAPWRAWARVDTSIVLRALFILAIVGSHTRAIAIIGGAHVLVALAGYSLARFRLHATDARDRALGVLRTAGRIAVPAVLWLLIVTPLTSRYHWYSPLLATNLFGPRSWWEDRWWNPWQMWFIEAVVYALLLVAALMAVPAVSNLDRRWPLALPAAVVAAGLTVRFGLIDLGGGPQVWYSAPAVLWLFGLGWAIARCAAPGRAVSPSRALLYRVTCSAVALLCVPGWFGDPGREVVIVLGLLALIWIPSVRLPRPVVRVLTPLAAASLFIYLTHFLVYPPIRDAGHVWLSFAASVVVGLLVWALWERGARAVRRSAPQAARALRRG